MSCHGPHCAASSRLPNFMAPPRRYRPCKHPEAANADKFVRGAARLGNLGLNLREISENFFRAPFR